MDTSLGLQWASHIIYLCTHITFLPIHTFALFNCANQLQFIFCQDEDGADHKIGERTLGDKLFFTFFSSIMCQLSLFDTYSDIIFVAITWKEGLTTFWMVSLFFVLLNTVCRILIPFYGVFRGFVTQNDKMDLISLISAFDYISVVDIDKELLNVTLCNMFTVSWRAISEDIPQAIIQLFYYSHVSSDKPMVLISAITSIVLAFVSVAYGAIILCKTSNASQKFKAFMRSLFQKRATKQDDDDMEIQVPLKLIEAVQQNEGMQSLVSKRISNAVELT